MTTVKSLVLNFYKSNPQQMFSKKEVTEAFPKQNKITVIKVIGKLFFYGDLERVKHGEYRFYQNVTLKQRIIQFVTFKNNGTGINLSAVIKQFKQLADEKEITKTMDKLCVKGILVKHGSNYKLKYNETKAKEAQVKNEPKHAKKKVESKAEPKAETKNLKNKNSTKPVVSNSSVKKAKATDSDLTAFKQNLLNFINSRTNQISHLNEIVNHFNYFTGEYIKKTIDDLIANQQLIQVEDKVYQVNDNATKDFNHEATIDVNKINQKLIHDIKLGLKKCKIVDDDSPKLAFERYRNLYKQLDNLIKKVSD